ncbi:MAG: NAD-dependent epimerase/dehydratase family protein, partial [Marinicellaceae bacterium]
NYHLENSHVIPALIRKFHEAKISHLDAVNVWGTGRPKREFLCSDDMAEACVFVMNLTKEAYDSLLASGRNDGLPPLLNIGSNSDLSIGELASLVKDVVDFKGKIIYDDTKPDGTLRKLMDSSRINQLGWATKTTLRNGLSNAYQDFIKSAN